MNYMLYNNCTEKLQCTLRFHEIKAKFTWIKQKSCAQKNQGLIFNEIFQVVKLYHLSKQSKLKDPVLILVSQRQQLGRRISTTESFDCACASRI